MKKYITDTIRRVEILAKTIIGDVASKADYAEEYDVAQVTINRDLEWLRGLGIQIFSRKNKIVVIETPPKQEMIKLLAEYLPLKLNSDVFSNQVKIFTKRNRIEYLSFITLLAKAVNEGRYVNITYQRFTDEEVLSYKLKPVRLIASGFNWILHAIKEDEIILKSFYVSRMKKVTVSRNKFKVIPVYKENKEAVKMIFRFSPEVASEITDKIWFDDFNTYLDDQGYIILETIQEISIRIATWCIGWWNMIEIIEPVKLKDYIRKMYGSFSEKNP